ncbi:MAG TPA: DUF427 domain-containing protein [Candidatus Binatia bacterium]|nr:DUF427 domain-containing protein [Candidatus Binatia bacterium]
MAGTSPPPPRIEPGPGQESVWDYPRPPRVEPVPEIVRVVVDGIEVAASLEALRVLETAGAPVYYLPREDVLVDVLRPSTRLTVCEWKGVATSWSIVVPAGRPRVNAAWSYERPKPGYESIAGYLAFYPGLVDEAWLGAERATPQPGGYYGGWVTSRVVGPFKGEPGSEGW